MNNIIKTSFKYTKTLKIPAKLNFQRDVPPKQVLSQLPSGIQIYTEQTAFPFHSDIGICFKAGLRNEKESEKGALFSLNQHMYHITENDCLENFEQTLKTGAMLDQQYDQELTYWKCSFIQEDFDQIADVLLKLVLNTKTISQETRDQFLSFQQFMQKQRTPVDDIIRKAAFGHHPIGNSKDERQELPSQENFTRFQEEMLTPQNVIIGYAGVWSHEQFREYIENKLVEHQQFFQRQLRKQQKAQFISQTYRQSDTNTTDIDIALLFKGCQWNDPDMPKEHILNQILGSSSSWSTGGPGKGMRARTTLNLMQMIASIESASGVKMNYTDCGIFGLRVGGSVEAKQELHDCLLNEFRQLSQISDEEFERGRNIADTLIQMNLERQADRLEESVKTIFLFGETQVTKYQHMFDNINKEDVMNHFQKIFNSEPTIMYYGKGVDDMPDSYMSMKRIRK